MGVALATGYQELFQFLKEKGVKLLRMETELFASVEAGDFDKFKELIKKETKETIDQVDFYGYTALHAAAESGRPEMIPMLLDAGANINSATYDATFTALHHALAKGHFDCAKILIERGADLTARQNEGKTAKDLADFVNEQEMTAFLGSCEMGLIPENPPQKQVRAAVVHREIVVPEGWGPG